MRLQTPPRTLIWGLLVAASTAGCSLDVGQACTAIFVYGLSVEVRDSVTGAPAGARATVTAEDGVYLEVLRLLETSSDSLTFVGAGERRGFYRVRVEKPGYQTWVRTGVVVVFDGCHVVPVTLEARLQPESGG